MISFIPSIIVYGLANAAVYLLVALGITLLFGYMRVFFFTYGSIYMLAAMLFVYFATTRGLSILLSIALVFVILAVFSLFFSGAIYPRVSYSAESGFIAFMGLSMILEGLSVVIFGALPKKAPTLIPGVVPIFGVSIALERLIVIPICGILVGLLFVFLYGTRAGKALRAMVQNIETSYLVGVNPYRVNIILFLVAFVLVTSAGIAVAPITYVEPAMGHSPLLMAFIIVILGGLGNIPGAILASILVALVESFVATYVGVSPAMMSIFLIILIMLILRPRGLFGRGQL